jgi:hypothetical protein
LLSLSDSDSAHCSGRPEHVLLSGLPAEREDQTKSRLKAFDGWGSGL